MKFNPKKHHRRSYRLWWYDYSWPGSYFLTLNVKHRIRSFGEIKNGIMHLSEVGQIANQNLAEIPLHYKKASLGEFIVMPDHIHLILILKEEDKLAKNSNSDYFSEDPSAGTCHGKSRLRDLLKNGYHIRKFGKPIPGSVSTIINQYKSSVKRWCNQNNHGEFEWQSRFHDRIIRDQRAFFFISRYIRNNPQKWDNDRTRKKKR